EAAQAEGRGRTSAGGAGGVALAKLIFGWEGFGALLNRDRRTESLLRLCWIALYLTRRLNLLKQDKSSKRGIKGKRLKAGWDHSYLFKLLGI
ncbi:MAG: hypothetical protein ABI147_06190, partial [Acidobacteriaceae bacterium]